MVPSFYGETEFIVNMFQKFMLNFSMEPEWISKRGRGRRIFIQPKERTKEELF